MSKSIFNLQNLFPGSEAELRSQFESALPYPHAVLPNAMSIEFGQQLFDALNALPFRWLRVKEAFYEHEVCNLLTVASIFGGVFDDLVQTLQEPTLVTRLCNFVGSPPATLVSLTGHRLYDGDKIGTHSDRNPFGETFRLLLFPDPKPQFSGGVLLLQEQFEGQMVTRSQVPYLPFQAYLFRFSPHSHHAVSPVQEHNTGANRLTILATYGTESV